jgi:hypothetical protein
VTNGSTVVGTALLGLSIVTLAHGDAAAKRLSSIVCTQLANEHAKLTKSGIERLMNGDPATARTSLKEEQLARIERFLHIEGQIYFRCPQIKLPLLRPPEPAKTQAAKLEKKQPKKPQGPAMPLPLRKPNPPSRGAGVGQCGADAAQGGFAYRLWPNPERSCKRRTA